MFLSVPILLFNMIVTPGKTALRRNIQFLHHTFAPGFLNLVGIRIRIEGRENLDPKQSYVIIGNHSTSLDFIVNGASFPGVFRFLAKQELQKIPVFGWVVKKMCLIVDRSSAISRARSVVALKQELAEGTSIFIYPEGSRNRSESVLAPFYDGAFRIAIQTGAPLAIQTIINIRDVSDTSQSLDLWPGVVRVVWEKPIDTTGMKMEQVDELKQSVHRLMTERIEKCRAEERRG